MRILTLLRTDQAVYKICDLCLWQTERGSPKLLSDHYRRWHLITNEAAVARLLTWKRTERTYAP